MTERLHLRLWGRRMQNVGHEVLLHHDLVADAHVSEAASLLVLAHAGVNMDSDSFETMVGRLAAVKDRLEASPEQMQRALFAHEPILARED